MVLFATVRANGAVWAPLIVLAVGLLPVRFGWIFATRDWLGADAIWTSFPVSSFANLALAALYYWKGDWRKAQLRVEDVPGDGRMYRASRGDARAGRRAQSGGVIINSSSPRRRGPGKEKTRFPLSRE